MKRSPTVVTTVAVIFVVSFIALTYVYLKAAPQVVLDSPKADVAAGIPRQSVQASPRTGRVSDSKKEPSLHSRVDNSGSMADELGRKFRNDKDCYVSVLAAGVASKGIEYCKTADATSDESTKSWCARLSKRFPSGVVAASDIAGAACPATKEQNADVYYRSMYSAAMDGDVEAEYCFIDRDKASFMAAAGNPDDSTIRELDDQSIAWARSAFERGDWRVVNYIASNLTNHRNSTYLLSALPDFETAKADPLFARLSLYKLLRLGAAGDYAASLDKLLSITLGKDGGATSGDHSNTDGFVTADEQAADSWAKNMFDRYFIGSPMSSEEPSFCSYPQLQSMLAN